MGKSTYAVHVLIGLNILLFILTQLGQELGNMMMTSLALYFPEHPNFRYWQLVTTMFMHGGFAHIFFNMFALWSFGTLLEQIWGYKKFLFFYFASGIGASIIYLLVNYFQFHNLYNEMIGLGVSPEDIQESLKTFDDSNLKLTRDRAAEFFSLYHTPAVGASGAIYGVLVAFGMLFPNAKLALIFLPVPIAAKYFIPILIAIDLFSGVTGMSIFGGGVAHFAHVGGALIGFLLMWYWRKRDSGNTRPEYL
jgi:membrane associated rhomboid family serine protease